ncbi:MAG: hypothetical protein U0103_24140 [Candidatus Obscuribacterales bacterium]
MSKQLVNSFWYGNSLTPYEVLCIKSFLDHGHSFRLYSYDHLDVPDGVELCDASDILPRNQLFFYRSGPGAGSVGAFANKFRYALLEKMGGWWVDMDIICLTDDLPDCDMFFSYEEGTRINNGMVRFPPSSPVMQDCLREAEERGRDLIWAETGPRLLTNVLERYELSELAQEVSSCYAIEWHHYLYFWDPNMRGHVEDAVSSSIVVHLWNEMVRRIGLNKQKPPPAGSYLDFLCKKHEIEFSQPPMRAVEIHLLQTFIRLRGAWLRRISGKQRWLEFGVFSKT